MGHAPEKTKAVIISAIKEHKGKTLIQFAEFHDRTAFGSTFGQNPLGCRARTKKALSFSLEKRFLTLKVKKSELSKASTIMVLVM